MYVRDVLSPTKYKEEPLTSMLNEKTWRPRAGRVVDRYPLVSSVHNQDSLKSWRTRATDAIEVLLFLTFSKEGSSGTSNAACRPGSRAAGSPDRGEGGGSRAASANSTKSSQYKPIPGKMRVKKEKKLLNG